MFGLIGDPKLPQGVSVTPVGLETCPGCTPAFTLWELEISSSIEWIR